MLLQCGDASLAGSIEETGRSSVVAAIASCISGSIVVVAPSSQPAFPAAAGLIG